MPARNEQDALPACLKSLIEQDYANLKILAVDDRSTDATGAIIDALAARHPDRLRSVLVRRKVTLEGLFAIDVMYAVTIGLSFGTSAALQYDFPPAGYASLLRQVIARSGDNPSLRTLARSLLNP